MRDTGIVVKGLSGDPEAAQLQIGIARTQLGILKNQMQFAGLTVGARTVRLPDGTVMQVQVMGGISRANITTATPVPGSVPQPSVPEAQVPVPVIPRVWVPQPPVPPSIYALAVYAGSLGADASLDQLIKPFTINGQLIDDALPNTPPHIIGTGVEYGFPSNSLNQLALLGAVNETTGAPVSAPVTITGSFASGAPILQTPTFFSTVAPVTLCGYKDTRTQIVNEFGGTGTVPADLTALTLTAAWEDSALMLNATTFDGNSIQSGLLVEGGANFGVTTQGAFLATSWSVNGIAGDADVLPCPTRGCAVVGAITTASPEFDFFGFFYMLYPNTRPTAGVQQDSVWASYTWNGTGDITFVNEANAVLQFHATASAYGTTVISGTLTIVDGYGVSADLAVSISLTLSP